jgi:YD repeat-containing protein
MYILLLHDIATMPHPSDRPRPSNRRTPDVQLAGGRIVESSGDTLVITIPDEAIDRIRRDPAVRYVQRVWLGESIDSRGKATFRQETLSTEGTDGLGRVTWSSGQYAYDPSGNIETVGADSYRYDTAGRLIKTVLNAKTETYGYDAYGNLISKTTDTLNRPFPAVDARTNRLHGYVYDVAGNLTNYGAASYQYDSLNMITMLGSASSVKQRFIYTPDDERIGVVDPSTGFARWRIRDFEKRVIREFTGTSTNIWRWDEDYVYAEGRIVAGERYATQGIFTQYHTDHLGSVRLITNQNGAKIVSKEYYPFGEE